MIKRFLDDTLELILVALHRLGLLHGGPEWTRERWRRRREIARERRENTRRAIAADHRMCRSCRALVPNRESRCPECGESMAGVPRGGAGRAIGSFAPMLGSVSTVLIGLIGLIYLAGALISPREGSMLTPSSPMLVELGAMRLDLILLEGQWWRLVNPIFLHGGVFHIGCNAYALSNIGPVIERVLGPRRYLVLFVVTGIGGCLASAASAFIFPKWSLGASGALCGLIGYGVAAGFRSKSSVLRPIASRLAVWAVVILLFGLTMPGIDNAGHIGGFVAGALFGVILSDEPIRSVLAQRVWTVAAVLAGLLPVLGFALAFAQ